MLRPVDHESFLPFLDLSFELGEGIWIVADPSFRLEDGPDYSVCLDSSMQLSYSEAESLDFSTILTCFKEFVTVDLLFRTDIQSGSAVFNEEE